MRFLKPLLWTVGVCLVLLIGGAVLLVTLVDPNDYRDKITQLVKEKKQRTLTLEGKMTLTVFPRLGINLGKTTLSEFQSEKIFAKVDAATVSVEIMPLLRKQLSIHRIDLEGVEATLIRHKNGTLNIDDLLKKDEEKSEQVKFDIESIRIATSRINVRDDTNGTRASLQNIQMKSGRIADKTPSQITLSALLNAEQPRAKANIQFSSAFELDLTQQQFQFSKVELALQDAALKQGAGLELNQWNLKLGAKALHVDAGKQKLSGAKIDLNTSGKNGKEPFQLAFSAPTFSADLQNLAVQAETLALKAEGRFQQQQISADLKSDAMDANLTQGKLAVTGLKSNVSGTVAGMTLSKSELLAPKLVADLARRTIDVSGMKLNASGKKGADSFSAQLDVPKLSVSEQNASGNAITGSVQITGAQSLQAKFNAAAVTGNAQQINISHVSLDAQAKQGSREVVAKISGPLRASLSAQTLELPELKADITLTDPSLPQKTVHLPISGNARIDAAKQNVTSQFNTKFDESTINAKLAVSAFSKPVIDVDTTIDKLNVDRYLPPPAKGGVPAGAGNAGGAGDAPIDLSVLKPLNLSARARIGQLQVKNIKASNVNVTLRAQGGKVDIAPLSANLYQGSMVGSASINAHTNSVALKQTLTNVNINPLMVDAIQKDILEGRGNVTLDVVSTGKTVGAMKRSLGGNASVVLKDGAYKGINLAKSLRDIKSKIGLKKNETQGADRNEKTDFSELSGTFQIANGVARNNDLSGKSPFLRVTGKGDIDIGNSNVDYQLRAIVVSTSTGQGGKDLAQVKDLAIPVRVHGPFDKIGYNIEWSAISSDALKGVLAPKLEERKAELKQEAKDKVKDKLKGLFGK